MVLPSQSGRTLSNRTHMYRRKRFPRWPVVIVIVVAAAFVLGWSLLRDDGLGPQEAGAARELPSQAPPQAMNRTVAVSDTGSARRSNPQRASSDVSKQDASVAQKPTEAMSAGGEARIAPPQLQTQSQTQVPAKDTRSIEPPPREPQPAAPTTAEATAAQRLFQRGLALVESGNLVEARRSLSDALHSGALEPVEADRARQALSTINDVLVFSPQVARGDPFAYSYTVQSGDVLQRIVTSEKLEVDWRFVCRINGISDPRRIQAGQRLKLIRGPFHAVVSKQAFRMDLYLGDGPERVFIASLPVGLGELGGTPTGLFRIRPGSKLIDPAWTNPRTHEVFAAEDPQNPIGEHWLGLQGMDDHNRDLPGYGIHGTIEPESIGREKSMGCIRLLAEDVRLVYEMLVEEKSSVLIVNQ